MIALVKAVHEEHPSHGYRWTAAFIRINHEVSISDNYAYKCFRYFEIKSETLTFGNGLGIGTGFDYYLRPIVLFEW